MIRSTTVIAVRHQGKVAIAADGQVTVGDTIMKHRAQKIRRLYRDKIVAGFAGSSSDALTLYEKFEGKLEQYSGNLTRAAVELARDWRTDRVLRRLEALLVVANNDQTFVISGSGDVIEPDDGIASIGAGGPYALAAARALTRFSNLDAKEIAAEALKITAGIDVYTNESIQVEEI